MCRYPEAEGISWTPWMSDPVRSPQLLRNWELASARQGRFFGDKLQQLDALR